VFLASDESEWVTGDVIKASGGGEVELRVGRDLPRARRSTRQGHPRTAATRSITRMGKAQCSCKVQQLGRLTSDLHRPDMTS
jgi:hypothetical protein